MSYVITATLVISKESAHSESNTSSSTVSSQSGLISNNNMVNISKMPRGRRQNNGGGSEGRVWCSYHKTTSHNDADCRVQQHKPGGNAHVVASRTQRATGVCSAYDLPEEDDEAERPCFSFTATAVQSKTEPKAVPRQKNGTWPFGPLTAARPWSFVEREKPAISLGGHNEPDLYYMYEGTDGELEPLYGTALIASGPAALKHKPCAAEDSVTF